ncbi:MAG: efflux RND transporter permease subunit [Planctomycetes bacterium]|nr:efflux RND transporter permease subunit [Planctomycetota bacterium]
MIAKIIETCCRNRLLVVLLTLMIVVGGVWTIFNIRLDAIPDLSDVQVIILTEYPGQAPQVVEEQVTYPLTTAMLAVPYAKVVRGYSFFGISFVYLIFEDGTDLYWARSRVLEYLNYVSSRLPKDVTPQLGPDATGVGWVYQYSLRNGYYCPHHPNGMYRHPEEPDTWYATLTEVPKNLRDDVERVRSFDHGGICPWDGETELVLGQYDLSELRSLQDWYMRYELTAVKGVSEVAAIGGFVRQYQVVLDPDRLLAYDISLAQVKQAIKMSNKDVGGRVLEMSETEYMVRGLGYLASLTPEQIEEARQAGVPIGRVRAQQGIDDLKRVVIQATPGGTPVYLQNVADVHLGPDIRRGLAESDGEGEVVGGIVIMRSGENALEVIRNVKAKINDLKQGLPVGVDVVSEYDRSALIERAVDNLVEKLLEEMFVVALVCAVFLLHLRSSLVAIFVIPTSVLGSLIIMQVMGLNANIMSLGGIAIAVGAMVDSSIVMVENAHKHYERDKGKKPHAEIIIESAKEVGPTLFFSLLIITVSFVPIFVLGEQSGRLFKPLAYTKTFAMGTSALLSITIVPILMIYFIRGRIPSERTNPISRLLQRVYEPFFNLAMRGRYWTLAIALLLILSSILPMQNYIFGRQVLGEAIPALKMPRQLGSEFMPPLNEGDLLYMPTTDPGISVTKARELLQQTDALIATFPEVHHVFGKIGRAETATDPAPLSMIETTIMLEPDKSRWRKRKIDRWFAFLPKWLKHYSGLHHFWPEVRPITIDELANTQFDERGNVIEIVDPGGTRIYPLDEVVSFPGLTNSWTMPIRTRIDMLSTGIKTPVGIKIMGDDLTVLADLAARMANTVRGQPGTLSAYPEKTVGGNYLDFKIDRDEIARYGLRIDDVQDVILTALGGMNITSTVEGLERYPVNLRYKRELRDNLPALRRTLVATPSGAQVPLAQLADITIHKGPPGIKSENARKTAWVYVDLTTTDIGGWVERAKELVAEKVPLPPGYSVVWSGQYEYIQAANKRLAIAVPAVLMIIILLLYLSHKSWFDTCVVLLAVPFSLIGAIWFLYIADYNMSLAVWVGLIALAGLDAETGMVMLLYLHNSHDRAKAEGRMNSLADLKTAIHEGAVLRIRPKTMTVLTTMMALVPIMIGTGTGSAVMKRMAAPMFGGLLSSFVMELLIYPVIFLVAKQFQMWREKRRGG